MKDTDQIAAEAADEWFSLPEHGKSRLVAIIKSAIEKSTEELANKIQWAKTDSYTEGYNKALGEWLRGENPSRAAHASEPKQLSGRIWPLGHEKPEPVRAHASEQQASKQGDPSEHEFRFDVCQKCGVSAFNLDENEPCFGAAHAIARKQASETPQSRGEQGADNLLRDIRAGVEGSRGLCLTCDSVASDIDKHLSQRPTPDTADEHDKTCICMYCKPELWPDDSEENKYRDLAAERWNQLEAAKEDTKLSQEIFEESAVESRLTKYVVVQITTSTWEKLQSRFAAMKREEA